MDYNYTKTWQITNVNIMFTKKSQIWKLKQLYGSIHLKFKTSENKSITLEISCYYF